MNFESEKVLESLLLSFKICVYLLLVVVMVL